MAGLQQYKCPCCGGAIEFNSSAQKMVCPYCDTEFEMSVLADYDKELSETGKDDMQWDTSDIKEWTEDENGMRVYVCKSCGGEIVGDEHMAASACPFCDNPIVVMGSVKGQLKPDYIIPFKLDKKAAKAKFADHLKGKKLLPRVFKDQNHIEEIKGVYVPYWLFDTQADAHMRYKCTRTRFWSDANYDYTETSYYAAMRDGSIAYEHVPVDGATKMPDDLMESLEPYNFKEAKPFQTAFFAGYYADKYDVDEATSAKRANERVRTATSNSFQRTVTGYDSVVPDGGSIQLRSGKAKYAMYPVWILNTTWNGEKFIFAMNGQTGKFVGNLPVDKDLLKKYFMKSMGITSAVVFVVMSLLWLI